MRHSRRLFASMLVIVPALLGASAAVPQTEIGWELQDSGVTVPLRGLAAVSAQVAWATGSNGTWTRTIDGGNTWQHGQIPGATELGVRDIHAFNETEAVALTIGSPGRVYRTVDGGHTWTLVFEDARPEVFFNCMDFADDLRGYAVGDPIGERFLFIETLDAGKTWSPLSAPHRPQAAPGEAQFAASGTCLQATGDHVWIGTGGEVARVFHSQDRGRTWEATAVPLQHGSPSQGAFGVLFWNENDGVVVGGDYAAETIAAATFAATSDGGATWTTGGYDMPGGFRSAVVRSQQDGFAGMLVVGRSGSDLSLDNGRTWTSIDGPGFYTVSIAPDGAVWAAGAEGRVARLVR